MTRKEIRKLVCFILAVAMLLGLMSVGAAATDASGSWQDTGVPDTAWYTSPTGGQDGSQIAPYIIDTPAKLAGFAALVNGGNNFSGKYIKLGANIDLGGKIWQSIGNYSSSFKGTFDGDGHIISNMTCIGNSGYSIGYGLFGRIDISGYDSVVIKNVGIVNVKISGSEVQYGGGLVGSLDLSSNGSITLQNGFVTGSISSSFSNQYLGGMVGYVSSSNSYSGAATIADCYTACSIVGTSANASLGGILGMVSYADYWLKPIYLNHCYSTSRIADEAGGTTGALVGYINKASYLSASDCLFDLQATGLTQAINGWNKTITGRTTSQMSGAGSSLLPTSWSTDVWQTSADTYPQLKVFASASDTATALYSWLSAVPIYLYENTTSASLSDTNKLARHSFNLPSISGATWSSSNSSVLSVSGNTVSFSAPASDTEVTLTLTKDSLTKDFTLMCKSGVNPSDTAPPQVTLGTVAPADFSATIPVTVDETSNVYVVTLLKSAAAPTVDEILSSNTAVHLSGSGTLSATITGLSCLTEYTAYACAVDSMGNVSSIVKADFTTLQDQTPPSSVDSSYFSTDTDTHMLSFGACFNEVGTVKYVVVPSSTLVPTSTQVSQGKDATGGSASYYGSFNYANANAASTLRIDIANYAEGSYSLYFVCVDAVGNVSAVVSEPNESTHQNSFIVDTTTPSGYSARFDETYINSGNQEAASFTVSGAENQATYNYTISSSGGAATVTGSGTISSATQQISGIDLSSLSDGTLTLSLKLKDTSGNSGSTMTDTVKKDTLAPSISLSSPIGTGVAASTATIELSFSETVTGVMNKTVTLFDGVNTYTYTIGASDSYISGTDTSCKATIPLSRFLDSTNKPLSLAHGKTYTAAISSGAYKDDSDNLISANANIGSFTVVSDTRSSAKAINTFSIGSYAGTIDQTNHTISVTVPYGTSVSALTPKITVSEKATVSPVSGAMQNFTTPVTYTVTAENGTTQSYTVTVTVASSNTGGSSSSGGASSSNGGNTNNEITIPVSAKDGSSKVVVITKDGKATISANDSQLAAIASAVKDIGTVTADVSRLKVDEATVPSKMVIAVQKAEGFRGLAVALPTGTVTLDKDALVSVSDKGDMTFSVKTISSSKLTDTQKVILGAQADSALVVDVNVLVGGTKTSTFGGGKITVSIPYTLKSGENSGSITVWFMKDDGTIEPKKGTYADGKVTFTTEHLSQYLIVSFPFADVAEDSWYYGSVAYAYNNGLFSGTSDKTFSPDAAMTRQMIWMVLARMDGKVPTNMDDARAWAVENGISDGTNPTSSVTREQMAKILYRYAQYKGYKTTQGGMAIREFSDYDSISEYALVPLSWAVNAGLVQGSDHNLMPQGGAARAQVATILLRFCQNIA